MINYSAVVLAALIFAYDYKVGYATAKPLSAPGTVVFFILQGIALVWYLFIAKKVMYYGKNGNQSIRINTSAKRAIPIYNVTLRADDPPRIDQVAIDFPKFVTDSGKVDEEKMSEWLKPLVEGKNKDTKKEKWMETYSVKEAEEKKRIGYKFMHV